MEQPKQSFSNRISTKAEALKKELYAIYLALEHPQTPWYAKVLLVFIIGYAISPIDLIPDFIPVIGLLDDILLIPLGIWLALKMIPANVMADCRAKAADGKISSRARWIGSAIIVLIWMMLLFWLSRYIFYNFIIEQQAFSAVAIYVA